jgi:hypothetical protein
VSLSPRVVPTLAWRALALGALALVPAAQQPSEVRAFTRSGQTFVTWRELSQAGVRYRIYRGKGPIRSTVDLPNSVLLGEVDDRSSRNQGRSLASGVESTWVIEAGAASLDQDQGLFVHTIGAPLSGVHYAVTAVVNGVEDTRIVRGQNSTSTGALEVPGAPAPVLQKVDGEGELWAHWVTNVATPFQDALSLWPSHGFNFRYEPGSAAGPRGLCVRLHAAGQQYSQGWPQRFEVPNDVDILALSDLQSYTSYSFWFGAQENLPGLPQAGTRVSNYTQRRVLWTLDWLQARLGAASDPERVYVVGGSMGAIGGMYLVNEAPERFAAAHFRNGLYDLEADDYRNPGAFGGLFGALKLNLPTLAGLPILTRTNALGMSRREPAREWPLIRTVNGRNDETVGWASAVALFDGLAQDERPAVHYWDLREHNPNGYWKDLERALLKRTFQLRRDRPLVRFLACSLDDDAGDGTREDGDAIGSINSAVDFDPATASATLDELHFELFLRAGGLLDDAPAPRGFVGLAPRRTGPFALAPGELVHFELHEGATRVDEHVLQADALGRLRTPRVPVAITRRSARFRRWTGATGELFLGAAPLRGELFQCALRGPAGTPWTIFLALGDASGAFGTTPGVDLISLAGIFDAHGFASREVPLPASLPAGTWIWGRALSGGSLGALRSVAVQDWP